MTTSDPTPLYELRHGSYYLIRKTQPMPLLNPDGEVILAMCDDLALCFDPETFTLFKHGSYADVLRWYTAKRLDSPFEMAVLRLPDHYPVDEINKCLVNTQHLEVFYRRVLEEHTLTGNCTNHTAVRGCGVCSAAEPPEEVGRDTCLRCHMHQADRGQCPQCPPCGACKEPLEDALAHGARAARELQGKA